jgi:geranylgeranyl diphosphate synthase type I
LLYAAGVEGPAVLFRYRAEIEREIARASPAGDALDDMQRYALGWTDAGLTSLGKCLRPSLCLLCCDALGGDIEQALPVATAIEMIHNFSLVHDDIEDGDDTRHHRATLWRVYGRRQALAGGIALWTAAYRTLDRAQERGLAADRLLAARRTVTDACQQMIEGQHLDISYEQRTDVSLEEYIRMISGKTGALLGASLQAGAILAGAGAEEAERFGQFGRELGLSFQIRDDILGIWGEGSATGKPVGADIARKKKTLPIVHAFQQAVGADRELLRDVYSNDLVEDEDIDAVLSILQRWNCRYFAQGLAEDYRSRAMQALAMTSISFEARNQFDELMTFVLERDY